MSVGTTLWRRDDPGQGYCLFSIPSCDSGRLIVEVEYPQDATAENVEWSGSWYLSVYGFATAVESNEPGSGDLYTQANFAPTADLPGGRFPYSVVELDDLRWPAIVAELDWTPDGGNAQENPAPPGTSVQFWFTYCP